MKKKQIFLVITCFFILKSNYLLAQCAMCKAVVESDIATGGTTGLGINNGILYLMFIPYLLIAVVGYFIYKNYKKNLSSVEKNEP